MKNFIFFVIATVFCGQVICNEILNDFVKFEENFPHVEISEKCQSDLKVLKNGIDNEEVWALMVQDLSGKPSTGFLWGNNFWLGSGESCRLINNPPRIPLRPPDHRKMVANVTDIASQIEVEYRIFYINHTSNLQFDIAIFKFFGLHIGLCFPKNCHQNDSSLMSELIFSKSSRKPIYGRLQFVRTKLLQLRDNLLNDPAVSALTIIFAVMIILIIIGTIFVYKEQELNKDATDILPCTKFWHKVSLQRNFHLLTHLASSEHTFQSINGLRTIFMIWVIIGHSFLYALSAIDNLRFAYSSIESPAFKFMYGAIIVVDSFFVFGGFLMSYNFFEHMKKQKPKHLVSYCVDKILKRFVRLNPPFMIIILISIFVGIYLKDTSTFILYEDLEDNCRKYWWRNLLMIQNWFSRHEICMSWSWFIAADFQLYSLTLGLLAFSIR
jgi:hypothetical protein